MGIKIVDTIRTSKYFFNFWEKITYLKVKDFRIHDINKILFRKETDN